MRPFWILFTVLALAGVFAGYYAVTWRGFLPKHIVVSGNREVSAHEIAQRAAISPRINMWLQNTADIANRVAAIPYVHDVHVYRIPPSTIKIAVTERSPFAIVNYLDAEALVDRDMRVLAASTKGSDVRVLVVPDGFRGPTLITYPQLQAPPVGAFARNAGLLRLRNDFETLHDTGVALRIVKLDANGDLSAITPSMVQLLLGDDEGLARKATLIEPILKQVGSRGRPVAAIDLRAPGTPVVVYR